MGEYEKCVEVLFDDLVGELRLRGFECRVVPKLYGDDEWLVDVWVGGFRYRFRLGDDYADDDNCRIMLYGQRLWGLGEVVGGEWRSTAVSFGLENPDCGGPVLCDCVERLVRAGEVDINYSEVIVEGVCEGLRGFGVGVVRKGDSWLEVRRLCGVCVFMFECVCYGDGSLFVSGKLYEKYDDELIYSDMYWWNKGPDGVVHICNIKFCDYRVERLVDLLANWDGVSSMGHDDQDGVIGVI